MKGLIIASGTIDDYNLLEELIKEHNYILCVDGGLNHIIELNIVPDLVLGDMDSISKKGIDYICKYNIKIEKYPIIKDQTDTELAISWMIERDFKEITLTGVMGSRLDHSLANIFLLKNIYDSGLDGKIVNENNIISYTRKSLIIEKKDDYYISIIPICPEGSVITLEGFLYDLKRSHIPFGSTLAISNKIVEKDGSIRIHNGEVLIFESRD